MPIADQFDQFISRLLNCLAACVQLRLRLGVKGFAARQNGFQLIHRFGISGHGARVAVSADGGPLAWAHTGPRVVRGLCPLDARVGRLRPIAGIR